MAFSPRFEMYKDVPILRHMRTSHMCEPCSVCVDAFLESIEAREERISQLMREVHDLKDKLSVFSAASKDGIPGT